MTIPCHTLISWHLARLVSPEVRERRWIAWAGIIPDLDGLGLVVDVWTDRTTLYLDWHHRLGHNFWVPLLFAALAAFVYNSAKVGAWAWLCFHLHLLADLISGRGPEGSPWPLFYGWPLTNREWQWDGQWKLDAWPNSLVFVTLLAWAFASFRKDGRTPLELVSKPLEARAVPAFRSVFQRGNAP